MNIYGDCNDSIVKINYISFNVLCFLYIEFKFC